jgi:hypothetical protein
LRSVDFNVEFSTRKAIGFGGGLNLQNFEGEKDTIYSIGVGYPVNNPYQNASVVFTGGQVGDERYSLVTFQGTYRFPNRISLTGVFQFEDLGGDRNTQHVIALNYELDQYRAIGGRAVIRDGGVNWYLAFRQSGNLGTEYYLIIGDPNADRFQRRIILKAVMPMDWRL